MTQAKISIADHLVAKITLTSLSGGEVANSGEIGKLEIEAIDQELSESLIKEMNVLPLRRIGTLNTKMIDFDDLKYGLSGLKQPWKVTWDKEPVSKPWIPEPGMIV